MTTRSGKAAHARLEARIGQLIDEAARQMHLTKTAFVTQVLSEASMNVLARHAAKQ